MNAIRCDKCGQPLLDPNRHIRVCKHQDPVEIAERILGGGEYLDAHAELVARAFLEAKR